MSVVADPCLCSPPGPCTTTAEGGGPGASTTEDEDGIINNNTEDEFEQNDHTNNTNTGVNLCVQARCEDDSEQISDEHLQVRDFRQRAQIGGRRFGTRMQPASIYAAGSYEACFVAVRKWRQ